jgi:hypothetical protein
MTLEDTIKRTIEKLQEVGTSLVIIDKPGPVAVVEDVPVPEKKLGYIERETYICDYDDGH